MAEFEVIDHEGEEIHKLDLRDDGPSNQEEVIAAINDMKDGVTSQPEDSVLALTLVENTGYNEDILEALKKETDANEPHVKKTAIVGISGLQKVALQAVKKFTGREFEQFEEVERAKDYLVE